MVKRLVLIYCLIFGTTILTGCWDNRDIDHRIMPLVMGVSKVDEDFKVILQIPQPTNERLVTKIVSETGPTVNAIIDKISADMESSVDLLHVKVIVIDKNLAEAGMKDFITGIMRSRDIPSKALIAISNDDIDEIFAILEGQEGTEGTILIDFFEKDAGWNPHIPITRVWHVYQSIHSYTHDVAIALIGKGESMLCEFVGAGVIKNGRMVESLNTDEALLYNIFNKESAQGKIEVLDDASVMILSNRIRNHSKMVEGRAIFDSTIKLKVMVLETRGDVSREKIKEELTALLKERYTSMFSRVQASEADIFGIGQFFRNEIPRKQLKNWRSTYYPELTYNQKIKVDIQNEGNLKLKEN